MRHHYVPQLLLDQFAMPPGKNGETKHKVYTFDMQTGRVRRAHIRNLAQGEDFYDATAPGGKAVSHEPFYRYGRGA